MSAAIAVASLTLVGCDDSSDLDFEVFQATLTAAAEIPAPVGNPTATGVATMTLSANRILRVRIVVNGQLTSAVTMAHIHGPASTATTAAIVLDFVPAMSAVIAAGATTGVILEASYDLDALPVDPVGVLRVTADELIAMLRNGTAYVNVHTVTNPAGEIRGQVGSP
jgi:hypothetical protein